MVRRSTRNTRNTTRRVWTKAQERELRNHSRIYTPLTTISRVMKRTEGALRQKALALRISLGHSKEHRTR
jgi:hypothetical protein